MGLCERCKKAQATFHLTNIESGGEKVERHLCERCATEEGLLQIQKPSVNVNDVLESFIDAAHKTRANLDELVCEVCGISYIEFRNHGLLGCSNDYDAFKEALGDLIERAQDGADHHVGKAPQASHAGKHPQQDIRRLKRQLAEAITAEDYERAAELRDRLAKLEGA